MGNKKVGKTFPSDICVNHNQLPRILTLNYMARVPTNIISPVGWGKTQSTHQFHAMLNTKLKKPIKKYMFFTGLIDATDVGGFPTVHIDTSHFPKDKKGVEYVMLDLLPFDREEDCIIVYDEIDRCREEVLNACTQLLLGGEIHGHKLSSGAYSVMTMNGTSDIYTMTLPEAIRNRICSIYIDPNMVNSMDSWVKWATANGIDDRIIGYMQFSPGDVKRETSYEELALCTPRSMEMLSRVVKAASLAQFKTDDIMYPITAGIAGSATAKKYASYTDIFMHMPDLNKLLDDPDSVDWEKFKMRDKKFAIATFIIHNVQGRDQAAKALGVLDKYMPQEIAEWGIRSIATRIDEVISTPEYMAIRKKMKEKIKTPIPIEKAETL